MTSFVRWSVFLGLLTTTFVVAWCALAPSPDLRVIFWLPHVVTAWADANPAFRNFPAFALLGGFVFAFGFFWFHPRLWSPLAALGFLATVLVSLLGTALECAQIWLPKRVFDLNDIAWSLAGSLAGVALVFFLSLPFAWNRR